MPLYRRPGPKLTPTPQKAVIFYTLLKIKDISVILILYFVILLYFVYIQRLSRRIVVFRRIVYSLTNRLLINDVK